MLKILAFSMVIAIVLGQGMGDGISKSTWGSSDPVKCAAWIKKYLPAKEAPDDCKGGKCECATQGRFQLENGSSFGGFGIHTINCTEHPYGTSSLQETEGKIQKEWGDFTKYHPFMDYNVGLWAPHLQKYINAFDQDGIKWTGLKWTSDDKKDYYSVLASPCGYVVVELIGEQVQDESKFVHSDMRFSFNSRNTKPNREQTGYLTPLKVSRATARMDQIRQYYTSAIGASEVATQKFEDGSEMATFMYDQPHKGVQIQFWSGRKASFERASLDAEFTVKDFEDYMHEVHKQIMLSNVCGFDQYADNHYAYDGAVPNYTPNLDQYAKHADSLGLPYHWWGQSGPHKGLGWLGKLFHQPPGGITQIYIIDPSGFSVQYDGPAKNPPHPLPTYSAACKSSDGCAGQGFCKSTDFFFMK